MNVDEAKFPRNSVEIAAALLENGYMPVPVEKREKRTLTRDWANKSFSPNDFLPDMNVGIRCSDGGVYFLDIDVRQSHVVEEIVREWQQRFGGRGTHLRRTGEVPKTGILFRSDPGQKKNKIKLPQLGERDAVEVLGKGQQFVAYGIHPKTQQPYRWHGLGPIDLSNGKAEDLPAITTRELQDFLNWLETTYGSPAKASHYDVIERETTGGKNGQANAPLAQAQRSGLNLLEAPELLKLLSGRQNLLASREDWLAVVHGAHDAASGTAVEEEVRAAVVDWSARWEGSARTHEHTDDRLTQDALYAWSNARRDHENPITVKTAMRLLKAMPERVIVGELPELLPHKSIPLPEHPVTPWLLDKHYLRGSLSITVAPGGTGKSMLAIHEALSIAVGRPLIGGKPYGSRRVMYVNGGEDNAAEVRKRVDAAMSHHGITDKDLGGRLFVWGAPELAKRFGIEHFKFATQSRDGVVINDALVERFEEVLQLNKIDVVILDPLKHFHLVGENDNDAMNEFATSLVTIAERANCAIEVVHHATKEARVAGRSGNLGIAQSRGASALIDKARAARFLSPTTKEEAATFGATDGREAYVSIKTGKSNYASTSGAERYFRIRLLELGNGSPEYPDGDTVGVLELATPKKDDPGADMAFWEDVLRALKKVPDGGAYSPNSPDWLGFTISTDLKLDCGKNLAKADRTTEQEANRKRMVRALNRLEELGCVVKKAGRHKNGKERTLLSVNHDAVDRALNNNMGLFAPP